MGSLDGVMGNVAKTLTKKFGRPATLVRPGAGGEYSSATGTITGGTASTSYDCEIVFEEFNQAQIDGTLVKAGDRLAIVSRVRLGTEPIAQSDTLVEGGRTWQILRVEAFSSGELEAAYRLHVRR